MAHVKLIKLEKRPRVKQILPTHCHFCEASPALRERRYNADVPFKGDAFNIPYRDLYCSNCEVTIEPDDAIQQELEALVLLYQQKYELLTAEEMKTRRKSLGLSQAQFCKQVKGISTATLKRMETGANVQDESTDQTLRIALQELESEKRNQDLWDLLHKAFTAIEVTPIDDLVIAAQTRYQSGWSYPILSNSLPAAMVKDAPETCYLEEMTA